LRREQRIADAESAVCGAAGASNNGAERLSDEGGGAAGEEVAVSEEEGDELDEADDALGDGEGVGVTDAALLWAMQSQMSQCGNKEGVEIVQEEDANKKKQG
jgi:hypothetical protein